MTPIIATWVLVSSSSAEFAPENMGAEFRPSAAVRNRASTIGSKQASFEASNQAFSVMRSAGPKTRHV